MDKEKILRYIRENFNISGDTERLIANIVDYADMGMNDPKETLSLLLDNTIGLTDDEIDMFVSDPEYIKSEILTDDFDMEL